MGRQRKGRVVGAAPDRWERLRGWLKRRQRLARRAVWLLAAAYLGLFLWIVGGMIAHALAVRRQAAAGHTFPAAAPPGAGRSQPDYRRAPENDEDEPDAPDSVVDDRAEALPTVGFNWRKRALLRQAAAVLAEEGDLGGAISLLLQDPEIDEAAGDVSQLAYARLADRLHDHWPAEVAAVIEVLRELPADKRAALLPPGRDAAALTTLVDADTVAIEEAGRLLPPTLLYCLLHNLHVALADGQAAPPQLVGLLLDGRFPQAGLAGDLYRGEVPAAHHDYVEHMAHFNAALNRQIMGDIARGVLLDLRGNIAAGGNPRKGWFAGLIGDDANRALWALEPQSDSAALEAAWELLPEPPRRVWSRRLWEAWQRGDNPPLPSAVLTSNAWTRAANEPVTSGFFLLAIRRHPVWQARTRAFEYEDAARQVPKICQQLLVAEYTLPLQLQVGNPLEAEKARLLGSRQDWHQLPRHLGIDAAIPPISDQQRQLWRRVSPRKVLQVMQAMAAREPQPRQDRMEILISLYALNRGYREDSDEDQQMQPAPAPPAG